MKFATFSYFYYKKQIDEYNRTILIKINTLLGNPDKKNNPKAFSFLKPNNFSFMT